MNWSLILTIVGAGCGFGSLGCVTALRAPAITIVCGVLAVLSFALAGAGAVRAFE